MKSEGSFKPPIEIHNRKARHEYFFITEFEAGILLTGTEIKSVRLGNAHMNDAYCLFEHGELYVRNMHIGEYMNGGPFNHPPRRTRKLMLRKSELFKLERKTKEKGFTIVPVRLFVSERGFAKLDIALAQGKKSHDKREVIQERDMKRDMDRMKKLKK